MQSLASRRTRTQLVAYASIGLVVQVTDIGLFAGLNHLRAIPELAASVAGLVALIVHFSLNKLITFRDSQRRTHEQLGTYVCVSAVWWLDTILIITLLTRVAGVQPFAAKLVAVAINLPLGYLAHRYLTFGTGIAARVGGLAAKFSLANGEDR